MVTTPSWTPDLRDSTSLASFRSVHYFPAVLLLHVAGLALFLSGFPACASTPVNAVAAAEKGDQSKDKNKDKEKPYALLAGTVWGPDDRPVYGVKVRIRRAGQKKAKWEQYSDRRGEFFQRLPAGQADYVVWADVKGFKSPAYNSLHAGTEVTVHIQNDERQDIGLHLTK